MCTEKNKNLDSVVITAFSIAMLPITTATTLISESLSGNKENVKELCASIAGVAKNSMLYAMEKISDEFDKAN